MLAKIIKMPQLVEAEVPQEQKDERELLDLRDATVRGLLEQSHAIQKKCEDFTVEKATSHTVRFNESAGITYIPTDSKEIRSASISRFALGQLGSKIGVPARYLEKCISSGRIDLAQDNVNSWLEDYEKDLFIREYDGGIRGVLSSKYSVCDTPEILEVVDDVLDLNKYKVKGYFLTPERFHLRLVQKEMLNIDGEDLFAGLTIDSSDVGRSILNCNFLIYKQVCTNGLIVSKGNGTLFQQKHVGISAEEFSKGLHDSLILLPDIISGVTANIEAKRNSKKIITSFTDEEEIKALVDSLRVNTRLSEEGATKVIDLMKHKTYDNSKWGLINSLTQVAQDYTLEKRLEIERYAGQILVA